MAEIEDTTKRTIEEVYDLQDGVFIDAKEFFSRSEAEIMAFRKHLEEAIQLNQPRFVCSHCRQMVKISGRITEKGKVSFFSHLHDSDDCDIKTTTQLSKEDIEARKYGMVGESERHKRLKNFIREYLEKDGKLEVTDVVVSKRINSDIPYLNWRCPDVSATYKGKKLVFELQLSTTFLSVIVDRDIFYRLNNYYVVWVFNFDNEENRLTLENLLAKDIYYANKRNVFILDDDAMDMSKKENRLYLSVTWLDENNKFVEKKLVAIDELSFDENSCKPYYYDADKDYYQSHPEEQRRIMSLERERQHIVDALMKKKKDEEEKLKRIEEAIEKKRNEMRELGCVATPYSKNKKWGYEYNGTKLTLPIYSIAEEIKDGYGLVVRNRRKGLVNQFAEEIVPCQYKMLYIVRNNQILVSDDEDWSLFGGANICKVKKGDSVVIHSLNDMFATITVNREKGGVKITAVVNVNGIVRYVDSIEEFDGRTVKVILKRRLREDEEHWINGWYYDYIKMKRLLTDNGYWLSGNADLSKDVVSAMAFGGGAGVLDGQFNPVSSFEYNVVTLIDDCNVKAKKDGHYGLLRKNNKTGMYEEAVPCNYENLEMSEYGEVFVRKAGKYGLMGLVDESGVYEEIVPCDYTYLVALNESFLKTNIDGKFGLLKKRSDGRMYEEVIPCLFDNLSLVDEEYVKAQKGSKNGLLRLGNNMGAFEQLIPCDYDDLEVSKYGYIKVCNGRKWGVVDSDNVVVLPTKYDSVGRITRKVIYVSNGEYKGTCDLSGQEIKEDVQLFTDNLYIGTFLGKYGLSDKDGNTVLDYKYNTISLLDNSCIRADDCVFMNNGELLCSNVKSIQILGNGTMICTSGECVFLYDNDLHQLLKDYRITSIKKVSNESNSDESSVVNNKQLFVFRANSLYGLCDAKGTIVQQNLFSEIEMTTLGYFLTKKTKERTNSFRNQPYFSYGLLDSEGKLLIECNKHNIVFKDGFICVADEGYGSINTVYSPEMKKQCEYYKTKFLKDGFIAISLSRGGYGRWGVVTSDWKQIVPCNYDEIKILSDDWFAVKYRERWGCVSVDTTQSFPCEYPNVCLDENGIPSVELVGRTIHCSDFVLRKRLAVKKAYIATVEEIRAYGVMVEVEGNRCLLHISEIKKQRKKLDDFNVGEKIDVVVLSFDKEKKRYSLGLVDEFVINTNASAGYIEAEENNI